MTELGMEIWVKRLTERERMVREKWYGRGAPCFWYRHPYQCLGQRENR